MIFSLDEQRVQLVGDAHFVAHNATVVGSVVLENNTSVWFNVVIRGDNDLITIGQDSNIQDGAVLHTDEGVPLTLGRGVTVGHMAMLHGCSIGDNCLIGIKAVMLNDAKIGNNCIVGAGTLIAEGKEYPDGSLIVGTPGRVRRQLTEQEIGTVRWAAEHYVENFQRYQKSFREQ